MRFGGACQHLAEKSIEEPQDERQANTDDKRGHERRIKLEAWLFDADIARQTPEPAQLIGSKPEHQACDSQDHADADQHFPEVFHNEGLLYRCATPRIWPAASQLSRTERVGDSKAARQESWPKVRRALIGMRKLNCEVAAEGQDTAGMSVMMPAS